MARPCRCAASLRLEFGEPFVMARPCRYAASLRLEFGEPFVTARPCRYAASLRLEFGEPSLWLGHADARQASDLNLANLRYGSAMPMRGKSPTCRRRSLVPLAVYDRGQRPP